MKRTQIKRRRSAKVINFAAELDAITPALVARSGGQCELQISHQCLGLATNRHHRQNRSQGGTNELVNILHLCGSGTTGCHGFVTNNPNVAEANGWTVRSHIDPATVPVVSRVTKQP